MPKRTSTSRTASPAPAPGFAQFTKHTTGYGQRMLQKMGWNVGKGLGSKGEGIVNPVETKQRPARMGMGFRGFDERTSQAKQEARERGEVSSSEEESEEVAEEETKKKGAKRGAWKRTGPAAPRKPKVVYKTATDILAETAAETGVQTQQKVIDMTGPSIREISLSEIKRTDSPTLMETTTRLPELRHNLRLLVDLSRGALENLSREKQQSVYRMDALKADLLLIEKRQQEVETKQRKIEEVVQIAHQLELASKNALASKSFETSSISELFGHLFDPLLTKYVDEVKSLGLDSLVVAVWAQVMKFQSIHWNVLQQPTWGLDDITRWRPLLRSNDDQLMMTDAGWARSRPRRRKDLLVMTPYEAMMNTIWLTRVRSAINNDWSVRDPDPLIQLMEAWKPPILPQFVFENIINQLILPKLNNAVSAWDPRNDPVMIHTWIHPWLPSLQAWRLADIFVSIRQKLSVILRQWHPSDESALHIITPWKEVWTPAQMESFLVKSVLPKLTQVLRGEFVVNPRDQQLEPLIWCLAWKDLLSETLMGQLLENEFFSKWLDVLFKWLTLDRSHVNYDEVKQWYLWWKEVFDTYGLGNNKLVTQSFRKGLDMMFAAANGQPVTRA
ncbi:GC-rich sequence DNA-binding factor-like protein-domain-containing protein [Radiomyces spectabilis]|uniref:GC-rich sequence DNA-binding factor-like protein-domain-containing protein n=1 Tax=Radiomyces spectabilis TaxID=64574 RepID=UPI0022201160|nr:GC-rich sequence DNA-binding factor-like protein-domain-containing protein [Radiomyces spectabilis]KAI8393699.1 GC-rich sequence DNA-binding factor-like protein-domain-containing protein [Radiomyces spectabilis]